MAALALSPGASRGVPHLQASITTRKGNRRFAVFDMTVVLGWEGSVAGSSTMVRRL